MRIATTLTAALGLAALPALAQDQSSIETAWLADPARIFQAEDVTLAELEWIARPLVVFANSARDPSFIEQMEEIEDGIDRLVERDVIVVVDTDPASGSDLRERLRPRGFMLALIGKDGEVEIRKPLPWTVRELTRTIDKMPLRQREIRENRVERLGG
jgi:hypothetical protein